MPVGAARGVAEILVLHHQAGPAADGADVKPLVVDPVAGVLGVQVVPHQGDKVVHPDFAGQRASIGRAGQSTAEGEPPIAGDIQAVVHVAIEVEGEADGHGTEITVVAVQQDGRPRFADLDPLVGRSAGIVRVRDGVAELAVAPATVLGTAGKRLGSLSTPGSLRGWRRSRRGWQGPRAGCQGDQKKGQHEHRRQDTAERSNVHLCLLSLSRTSRKLIPQTTSLCNCVVHPRW